MTSFEDRVAQGARNLLRNCAGLTAGQSLLVIHETETVGYYDPHLAPAICDVARTLGIRCQTHGVPFEHTVRDPDARLVSEMEAADCTLFLARLGDQIRFRPTGTDALQVISYALDREMLASPFGTVEHAAFEALKALVNNAIARASVIRVTCPAGTSYEGRPSGFGADAPDTTRKRFPVSVFAPIPAQGFSGRIAVKGFLTGTGSQYYEPLTCPIEDTLYISFRDNQITDFDGRPGDVAAARAHYEFVGRTFGIDTYHVHSWHAGIHPGCAHPAPACANFERWGGSAFGNPRLLHFHTCGAYPPGEISLNLLDPTIHLDDIPVWENGRLYPDRLAGGTALLERHPDMQAVFDQPAQAVGQAASGQLSYTA